MDAQPAQPAAAQKPAAARSNTPAQTRLLAIWEKRLAALAALRRKPALGKLTITGRKQDGSILFRAIPGWEIGRTHRGTFIPGPARSFTYRLHRDGTLCGHGYGSCGCSHGTEETSAAQAAWTAGGKAAYAAALKPAQRTARGIAAKKPAAKKQPAARKPAAEKRDAA